MVGKRKTPEPAPEPEPAAAEPERARDRDPWSEPCPLCGLLGCRRHA